MFTLYLIFSTLSLLVLGNITQSTYGKIAFSVSERWKQNRSIVNVLNWMSRHFDDIAKQKIKPKLDKDEKEKRVNGYAVLRMVHYLLGESFAHMIELWNPKDARKRRLLGKKQVEMLETGIETNYSKGGISPFTLTQIAYAIGVRYTEEHGTAWTVEDIDNKELFDIAEAYHAEKEKERKARAKAKEKESSSDESETDSQDVFTVDDYLNGDLSPKDTDNVDLLKQFRENESVKGAKKGALTRRINELERA